MTAQENSNKVIYILATWRKFPECVPDGDTRKILIAVRVEGRAGDEVHFEVAWWHAPTEAFKYALIENANHLVLYWMELPNIEV